MLSASLCRRLLRFVCVFIALAIPASALGAVHPGTIPGAFRVGDQGEGTYTIPIDAPAATGGLRPNLALMYNHLGGNGLAGMRWQLTGISAITRCQQTYAQDGAVHGVSYTSTDRFCLDGQRLVNYQGDYGASGTQYRTERETFQKIMQDTGPQNSCLPGYFSVQHGNGLTSFFGCTADSKVEKVGTSTVRIWYLSYTEDQFGNRVSYVYTENTTPGETVPAEIAWTSNATQGLAARYKVSITYETRPADDQRSGYDSGGALWAMTKRIDKIDVIYTGGGSTIRTYDLTYVATPPTGTGRSQLERVSVCRGTDCLPETVFTLQNGTRSWGFLTTTNQPTGTYPLVGDMNGDGRQDVYLCHGGTWKVYPGQANALLGTAIPSAISCATNPEQARVIDFNGDARADLLFRSGANWNVLVSTGTAFTNIPTGITGTSMPNPSVVDFDGDGLGDLMYALTGSILWRRNSGSGTGSAFASFISIYTPSGLIQSMTVPQLNAAVGAFDANGDRRTDVVTHVYECLEGPPLSGTQEGGEASNASEGDQSSTEPADDSSADTSSAASCANVYYLLLTGPAGFTAIAFAATPDGVFLSDFRSSDVNGDGLDDLLYVENSTWRLQLSYGTVLGLLTNTSIPADGANRVMILDYDSDGRDDLVRVNSSSQNAYFIHRSNGTTLPSSATESLSSGGAYTATAFAADVSGDGFPEIVRVSGSNWATHKHNSLLPDVVTAFTDGLGYTVGVAYAPLANYSDYTVNPATTPPAPYIRKYNGPRHAVTTETHDTGIGAGTRTFTHRYDTAYVDASGRGWLSFYWHIVKDDTPYDDGQRRHTLTYFGQTWPFTGMVDLVRLRRTSDNQIIREVDPTLITTPYTAPTPDIHFARVETTTTKEWEVGGAQNNQHLRTIVDDPKYDEPGFLYGHVTERTITVTDPVTAETWTSKTLFNPTADADDWCLGQPGLVETTNTLSPVGGSAVRRIRHTFNLNDCSLTETRDESESSTAKQLKTTFTRDAYGNPDIVSEDSVDGSAQNRSRDFNFDIHGQFPVLVTLATVNLTTAFTWNYLEGQPASVTGPDGLRTDFEYDSFGRITKEDRPVGETNFTYVDCGTCWPQNASYFVRAVSTDGSDDHRFLDELGRVVGSSTTLPLVVEQGRQETRYKATGQVAQVSQPYIQASPNVFWTSYQYDLIGRLTTETAPVSESDPFGAITTYTYSGHEVSVTDAENNTTDYLHNAARQIKQVTDAMNNATTYTYRPFGELATATVAGYTTTVTYDARGFKTQLTGPDYAQPYGWGYNYNVYGELSLQRAPITAPPNWTTALAYDEAGRITKRCDVPEGASTTACDATSPYDDTTIWAYYPYNATVGNRSQVDTVTGPTHALKFTYDGSHGLPTQVRYTLDGTPYLYDMLYEVGQTRLDVLTYPESSTSPSYRFKVNYDYDPRGHMIVAKDGNAPSTIYYQLDAADALGRELNLTLGNGLHEYRDYDLASGHLLSIATDPGVGSAIQDLSFTYDEVGNLLTRKNGNIGSPDITETLTYDALNRLDTSQVTGQSLVDINYMDVRISSKTGVGTYTYTGGSCGGGPFAVKNAGGKTYCYDANGRMTSRGGSGISWYSYDLPKVINNGTQSSTFSYGVDRARYKQVRKTGSTVNSTVLYIGDLLEKETVGATNTWRHYVRARGRMIAQVNRVGTTNTTQYLHRDHQGSVVEITNGTTGAIEQSLAFDPWGLRRNPANWAPLLPLPAPFGGTQLTERGYTGHEHLDNIELIHMNGRVQDPVLGLMISADPFVQAPYHSPALNRYSYVWNNPVSLVDPSGFQVENIEIPQYCIIDKHEVATICAAPYMSTASSDFDGTGFAGTAEGAQPRTWPARLDQVTSGQSDIPAVVAGAIAAGAIGGIEIIGDPQNTTHQVGDAHAALSQKQAQRWLLDPDTLRIFYNRSMSTISKGLSKLNLRFDVGRERKNGMIDIHEVVSPSQTVGSQIAKQQAMLESLPSRVRGNLSVSSVPKAAGIIGAVLGLSDLIEARRENPNMGMMETLYRLSGTYDIAVAAGELPTPGRPVLVPDGAGGYLIVGLDGV